KASAATEAAVAEAAAAEAAAAEAEAAEAAALEANAVTLAADVTDVTVTVKTVAEVDLPVVSMMYGGGTPLSIDPALNSAVNGMNILKLGQAGLMGYRYVDGVGSLQPELAESYTVSEDGLTYVFTLRENLKWSDGSDFSVKDVEFSWRRAAGEALGADYGFMFDVIEGYPDSLNIVADEKARTFTVKLINPTPYFLNLASFPTFYVVKESVVDNEGVWATKPETYIGMGPFRMTKYAVDDVISWEKNEFYWNADAVTLSGVNSYLSEDNVAILTAYENDTIEYVNQSIDPAEYPRIQATYPGELKFGDYIGTYYILFNVHKDLSPAGKQLTVQEQSKARIALGMMPDRVELVEFITQGGQAPATGFYPTGLADGLNKNVRAAEGYGTWYTGTDTESELNAKYTKDQAEACQMLIDLGYAYIGSIEGGDIKFTDVPAIEFSFNNAGANKLIIEYVQEIWNSFGITSTINTEAWATLQDKLKKGDAEAARMGWIADFSDCVNFLEIFITNSGNNYPRLGKDVGAYTKASEVTADAGLGAYWGLNGDQTWADAYDALVAKIKASTDAAERAALCAEAEKVLMATGGAAPLYFYTNPYLLKPFVSNVLFLSTGEETWQYAIVEK
ncbi:MAG: peptide ABC transporter substrate-binding protein, partial [Firmicutes bacterium]|nr:peptide ABC transporter substrate-binding protein [Bacillota bacterium]